jgi:hypothetical protein
MDKLQIDAGPDESGHLDQHQNEPEREQGIPQFFFGQVLGCHGNDQGRTDQGSATDVSAHHEEYRVDRFAATAKRSVDDVGNRIKRHDNENDGTQDVTGHGNQPEYTNQLGHNHDGEDPPQVLPVDSARARLTLLPCPGAIVHPDCQG